MAIKTISQFEAATPTSNDKILFEQNGEGKSATIGDAVNTCSLTYEEIVASTDLSGKVASASAIKNINSIIRFHRDGDSISFTIFNNCLVIISGDGNDDYYMGVLLAYSHIDKTMSNHNDYDNAISYNGSTGLLTLPTAGHYRYAIIF